MNKVELVGRWTKDVEVRYTQGERPEPVARGTLAVERRFKTEGGPNADFINCVAFGHCANIIEQYAAEKGTKIAMVGRIQTGSYTDKNGNKVYTTDVVVEEVTL